MSQKKNTYIIFLIFGLLLVGVLLFQIIVQDEKRNEPMDEKVLNIIIGDSRFSDLSDEINSFHDVIIAKSGATCNYLEAAIQESIEVIKANPDKKISIYVNLGVNDLNYMSELDQEDGKFCSAKKYFEIYKKLSENEWKNQKVYFVFINPIDKNKISKSNKRTMENILEFNEIMSYYIKDTKISYCDTMQYLLVNGFSTKDGLHYTDDTTKDIYNYIHTCH